ncbi:MAG: hypothetical protein HW412_2576 [Bacteroidetes bacterium]|nr:hypothetical protein [Bacteroidota bacterium]
MGTNKHTDKWEHLQDLRGVLRSHGTFHQPAENHLCRLWEFPLKHPTSIVKLLCDWLALVFSKIIDHIPVVIPAEITCEVDDSVRIAEFVYFVDGRTDILVSFKLDLENLKCCPNIGIGTVRVLQNPVAIEFVCGRECPFLFLMIDGLNVNKFAAWLGKLNTTPSELLNEQWKIEPVRVEAGNIAAGEKLEER